MLISTQTEIFEKRFGIHDAVKYLAEIGYDALDYSMFDDVRKKNRPIYQLDYKEYASSIRKTADEYEIKFNQAHAPFPSVIHGNDAYNSEIFDMITRCMEVSAILGADAIIVHPISVNGDEKLQKELNMSFYGNLLPYAKKFKIKIALENMWNWNGEKSKVIPAACSSPAQFIDYIDSLGSEYFTACLDIGHSEMGGLDTSASDMIHSLENQRLTCIHLHDNDKIHDLHMLPFTQKINFNNVMSALRDINYKGYLTFEADTFLSKFPASLLPTASRLMLSVGKHLCNIFETGIK